MYPKTYVELKHYACYLKNKVSAHRLGLVIQLSWRVAPPLNFNIKIVSYWESLVNNVAFTTSLNKYILKRIYLLVHYFAGLNLDSCLLKNKSPALWTEGLWRSILCREEGRPQEAEWTKAAPMPSRMAQNFKYFDR